MLIFVNIVEDDPAVVAHSCHKQLVDGRKGDVFSVKTVRAELSDNFAFLDVYNRKVAGVLSNSKLSLIAVREGNFADLTLVL